MKTNVIMQTYKIKALASPLLLPSAIFLAAQWGLFQNSVFTFRLLDFWLLRIVYFFGQGQFFLVKTEESSVV